MRSIYVIISWSFPICNNPFSFFRYRQLTVINSTNLFCVVPYFSSFSQINWVYSINENRSIFSIEHSSHYFCCFGISHKANISSIFLKPMLLFSICHLLSCRTLSFLQHFHLILWSIWFLVKWQLFMLRVKLNSLFLLTILESCMS